MDYRFPIELERAFCAAVNDYSLMTHRAELAGFTVISGRDLEALELGRAYLRRSEVKQQISKIERRLAGRQA